MPFNWKQFFPQGRIPRKQQQIAIDFTLQSFINEDKKFVILQLPVGVGKSFIATTVAEFLDDYNSNLDKLSNSYILTTQIILQEQYRKQFDFFSNISSRVNYPCNINTQANCADIHWLHKYSGLSKCTDCVYDVQKKLFVTSPISITNMAFFIKNVQYNESMIRKRHLLVVDQAHNTEEEVIRHMGLDVEFNMLAKQFGLSKQSWPSEKVVTPELIKKWIFEDLLNWVTGKKQAFIQILQKQSKSFNKAKLIDLSKKYDFLDKLCCQINRIKERYQPAKWVFEHKNLIISAKPLYANQYSQDFLFSKGQKVLMMSGTILNKHIFCKNLGINVEDCNFLSLDSPFDVENRRIYILNSGSMSKKNIDKNIDNVILDIQKILKLHKEDKGIIHVSSHYIAKTIYQKLNDERILIVNDFKGRNHMLDHHTQSIDNTVLISPSLMEGLDLKDDLSRFQIIAKIPFPNLGSNYVRTKKQVVRDWYAYQTVKIMVQAYGRSVRSENDYAMTYILDSDWKFLYNMNKRLFPKFFKEALIKTKI